jgi:hypothetical protein
VEFWHDFGTEWLAALTVEIHLMDARLYRHRRPHSAFALRVGSKRLVLCESHTQPGPAHTRRQGRSVCAAGTNSIRVTENFPLACVRACAREGACVTARI